ncbi:AMP-binding protein [Conexibacter sp. SYSU D00693]|uniref:AMP-binding protein n=1 Tax=Conexibacter sp. SYSU D00693 TaxID=2812560 RepID=UPI00196B5C06|nr:AMP-binding protein [Conexibacter sp. SYSU D00693]
MSSTGRSRRFERVADVVSTGAQAAKVFAGAGLVTPIRPDRGAKALAAVAKFGQSPAGGYAAAAALEPDRAAIIDERGTLTFAEVEERTTRLANALARRGISEGDGVALMMRNHRGFVETVIALSKLGADGLMLNTAFAGPQLTEVVEREGPEAVIHDAEFTDLLADALQDRTRYVAWTDDDTDTGDVETLEQLIEDGAPTALSKPGRHGRTTILTSGTTGTPKGATRGGPTIGAAVSILSAIPLRARERVFVVAPLFHQWGFAHLLLALLLRSTLVLRRKFKPEETLKVVEEERVACLPMVPVMCRKLLDLDEETRSKYDTSTLRTVPVSGSALPGDLAIDFMDAFGDVLYNLYGSTEVAWAAIASPRDLREAPGTAGPPPHGTKLEILGDDDQPLPPGETGRIFVGNDMLFEGYTGGGSKDVVRGLMATGDVGHLDEEGRLFVEGRDDDMIVSGGENVFPQEVEDTLARHEAVADVAVVGVEDDEWGQRLKAYVVKEGDVDEKTLKQHVKEQLAGYKVPREIVFLDELPRNPAGKVLKRELDGDREGDEAHA